MRHWGVPTRDRRRRQSRAEPDLATFIRDYVANALDGTFPVEARETKRTNRTQLKQSVVHPTKPWPIALYMNKSKSKQPYRVGGGGMSFSVSHSVCVCVYRSVKWHRTVLNLIAAFWRLRVCLSRLECATRANPAYLQLNRGYFAYGEVSHAPKEVARKSQHSEPHFVLRSVLGTNEPTKGSNNGELTR